MQQHPQLLRRPLPPKISKLSLYKKKTYPAKTGEIERLHAKFTKDKIKRDNLSIPEVVSKDQSEAPVQDAQEKATAIAIAAPENIRVPTSYFAADLTCIPICRPVSRGFSKERCKIKSSRKSVKGLQKVEKSYIQTELENILILSSKFSEITNASSSTITVKIKKVLSEDHAYTKEPSLRDLRRKLSSPLPSTTATTSDRHHSGHFTHAISLVRKVVLSFNRFSGAIAVPRPILPRKPGRQSILETLASESEKGEGAPKVLEGLSKRKKESDAYVLRGEGFKTIAATKYETIIAMSNMAIVNCQIHGRNALNLKGFFLLHCPDLTPLAFQLIYLNLSFNDLRHFPTEIFCLKHLQILKMRNNPIREIPTEIYQLKFLRIFSIAFNLISNLPYGLFALYHLEELDISYNEITFIPNDIKKLRSLNRLNIDGNYLFFLPPGILKLNLTKIYFDNTFTHHNFWAENSLNSPQRLTHICCLFIVKNNIQKLYTVIPSRAQRLLKRVSRCEWCHGPKYGKGFRVIRSCDVFGAAELPVMFHVCSSFCYRKVKGSSFASETFPVRKKPLIIG